MAQTASKLQPCFPVEGKQGTRLADGNTETLRIARDDASMEALLSENSSVRQLVHNCNSSRC